MARSKNSLTDVSPASSQFKQSFSNDERTQLNVLNKTSGGFGSNPTNGSGAFDNFTYNDRAKLEIGGLYAEGLEKSGITRQNSSSFISRSVIPGIDKREPLHSPVAQQPDFVDLYLEKNRIPNPNNEKPPEAIARSREDLVGSPSIVFPIDLVENAHAYIALDFYKYSRTNPFVSGTIRDDTSIYLPVPENLTQNFSVKYNPQDVGLAMSAANELQDLTGGQPGIENAMSALGETTIKELRESGERLLKYVGQGMAQGSESALGGLVGRQQNQIANPHPSVFFNGVDLRTYTMEWVLVPRNSTESNVVRALIRTIRDKALPKRKGNFLSYPALVKPTIKNANFGANYKKAHISSISINYTAAGTSAFFVNGQPVAVQLSLEFSEAELYLEDDSRNSERQDFLNEVLGEDNIVNAIQEPEQSEFTPRDLLREPGEG